MAEEQRILYRFRHQRPGQLLKTGAEKRGQRVVLLRQNAGKNTHDQAERGFRGVDAGDHATEQRNIRWRQPLSGAVGAIHRKRDKQLAQGMADILMLHFGAVMPGQLAGYFEQRGKFTFKITIGHQPFGFAKFRLPVHGRTQRLIVERLQSREVGIVHQHFRQRGDELIARGPRDRPLRRKLFPFCEDLLNRDVAIRSGRRTQALQIAQRIGKPVHMVNAQAVDNPGVNKLKDQAVRVCEDRLILYPHADQPGDFKKAPP